MCCLNTVIYLLFVSFFFLYTRTPPAAPSQITITATIAAILFSSPVSTTLFCTSTFPTASPAGAGVSSASAVQHLCLHLLLSHHPHFLHLPASLLPVQVLALELVTELELVLEAPPHLLYRCIHQQFSFHRLHQGLYKKYHMCRLLHYLHLPC